MSEIPIDRAGENANDSNALPGPGIMEWNAERKGAVNKTGPFEYKFATLIVNFFPKIYSPTAAKPQLYSLI